MNGLGLGIPDLAKMRQALLAGFLGLGLAAPCSDAALALASLAGPHATIDSATDDDGGRIRISWSLETTPPEGHFFTSTTPGKVCVIWAASEDGEYGPSTETCFTSEISSLADLVVDTGLGEDGPTTTYQVMLVPYYAGSPLWPQEDGVWRLEEVTLNESA